jgi:pimeloyl-ACP methyl ester carboxylesterase
MAEEHRSGIGRPNVVLVHGGPGACGSLAPLARRLSARRSVMEPWSTATSVEGEIEEIAAAMRAAGVERAVLVGHSWGAWLVTLVAERHPEGIAGIVWIGCPPFTAAEAEAIGPTRTARLTPAARAEVEAILGRSPADPAAIDEAAFARLGRIFATTDDVDPVEESDEPDETVPSLAVYRGVWPEAAALRASGELLRRLRRVAVPIVAFHGDHDPHPIEAIARIGAEVVGGFRLERLAGCGHSPWRERRGGASFVVRLEAEIDRLLDGAPRT